MIFFERRRQDFFKNGETAPTKTGLLFCLKRLFRAVVPI
jgi:hypothetical protein